MERALLLGGVCAPRRVEVEFPLEEQDALHRLAVRTGITLLLIVFFTVLRLPAVSAECVLSQEEA